MKATRASTSLLSRAGVAGAVLGGVLTIGLPAFLTAYGSGQWTFLLLFIWAGVLSPAGGLCGLFGWRWHLELHSNLFEYWPQMLVAWLVDWLFVGSGCRACVEPAPEVSLVGC
jgi:hypothetical protein